MSKQKPLDIEALIARYGDNEPIDFNGVVAKILAAKNDPKPQGKYDKPNYFKNLEEKFREDNFGGKF